MADMDDAGGGNTRWLSYDELAKARGISKASATRMAFRKAWKRGLGNDGTARVAVPLDAIRPREDEPETDTLTDIMVSAPVATPAVMDGLLSTIRGLQGHLEKLEARLATADGEAKFIRDRLSETERDREALRQDRDALRQDREEARIRTAAAEGEAKALREALKEAQRPFWHRWIGR